MTQMNQVVAKLALGIMPMVVAAQTLDPAELRKPLGTAEGWNTYSGDYSGQRFSALKELNQSNVKDLKLAWSTKVVAG